MSSVSSEPATTYLTELDLAGAGGIGDGRDSMRVDDDGDLSTDDEALEAQVETIRNRLRLRTIRRERNFLEFSRADDAKAARILEDKRRRSLEKLGVKHR